MENTQKIYNYKDTLHAFNELSKWFDLSGIYTITLNDSSQYQGGVRLQGIYDTNLIRVITKDAALEIIEAPFVADTGFIQAVFKYENINFYVTLT
jgi:hypothetical protein